MLVEATLLSSVAGLLGLILAYWTAPLLLALSIRRAAGCERGGAGAGFDLARRAFGACDYDSAVRDGGEALAAWTP